MSNETPVVESTESVSSKTPAKEEAKAAPAAKVASPASDLRDIQSLLVMGIFPGQMAPAVVKSYQLLESMAQKVELDAKNEAEFKARQAL